MKLLLKISILACIMFGFTKKINAQAIDTSTTQKLLQYIFSPIDKTQIPTGILEEYGAQIIPMETFNGNLTDSNYFDMNLWRTLYFQLQTDFCGAGINPFPVITTVNDTIKQHSSGSLPITIPLIIGNYNMVKASAFSANLLHYNATKNWVEDVTGRTQNPYQTNNLFAACPTLGNTQSGTATFLYTPNLVWNNTGKLIQQLSIDFNNGQGMQNISVNTPITISYTDTGTKRWTIKVILSDNSILQCYAQYDVMNIVSPYTSGYGAIATDSVSNVQNRYAENYYDALWQLLPTANYSGANVYIIYSNKNRSNTLRKPLIVVEGYDVSEIAPSLQSNYSYNDFIDAINEPRLQYDFSNQLDDVAGYDLVFIDFTNGADDITRNAALVQTVITMVNNVKVPNTNNNNVIEQNVVMGMSMGGLCARYALAQMTKNNIPTQTRLLITHDSPHHGANVPLGLQYFIQMLGGFQIFGTNVYDIYPQYNDALNLLNAPATQQLLAYRATSATSYVNNTFIEGAYRSMITFGPSDPQPSYRFIATSLGNECGHQLFAAGNSFIKSGVSIGAGITTSFLLFHMPIATYKLQADVFSGSIPSTPSSSSMLAKLYTYNSFKLFGVINIFKQVYNNTAYASSSLLPIDGVPGSISPLLDVSSLSTFTNLPIFTRKQLYLQIDLGVLLGGYFNVSAYNSGFSPQFTFVSTVSALDVSPVTTPAFSSKYVNGTNQAFPTTSDTYIAQETNTAGTSNNVHIRFTARNSNWMFNEMENLPNNINCSSECSNPYYISGNNILCTNGIYTVPGLQRGATIVWSSSPAGIVTISSPNSQSTLVTKGNNGSCTLTATLGNACGTSPILSTNILAGLPTLAGSSYSYGSTHNVPLYQYVTGSTSYNSVCTASTATATVIAANSNSIAWSLVKSSISFGPGQYEQVGNNLNFGIASTGATAIFQMNATNTCGTTSGQFGFKAITCTTTPCTPSPAVATSFAVTPNPAKGTALISTPNIIAPISPPCNGANAAEATETTEARPADDKATDAPTVPTFSEVNIYDYTGALKKKFRFGANTTQTQLDLSGLPAGMYMVQIIAGDTSETHSLLIQQ